MLKLITTITNTRQEPAVRYVVNRDIDREKWNNCIEVAPNSQPYAYSWYLDVVAPEWNALVLGDYETIMPLPIRQKLHIRYVYQPFFVQQLGVFSVHPLSQKTVNLFLKALPSDLQYVDAYLNEGNNFVLKSGRSALRLNYILSLNKKYDLIYNSYSTNTKRNVKKARTKGLFIHDNLNPELAVELYRQNVGSRLPALKAEHYYQLKRLIYECIHRGMGVVKGVYTADNQLCAAAFFIHTSRRIINLLPAMTPLGKENGAMFLLMDETIRANSETKCLLDFEGSMIASIARFYKGFGGNPINYWHIQKNDLPWYIRWWKE